MPQEISRRLAIATGVMFVLGLVLLMAMLATVNQILVIPYAVFRCMTAVFVLCWIPAPLLLAWQRR